MAHEETFNRSSAMTPEQLAIATEAATQAAIAAVKASYPKAGTTDNSAAVREAVTASVTAVFASLAPMLEKLALTPEKIAALRAPHVDETHEKLMARMKRENIAEKEENQRQLKISRIMKEQCPHIDKNNKSSINLCHNFPDHQPRGVCVHCHDVIHPREWRMAPPDPETGRKRKGVVNFKDHPEAERVDKDGRPAEYSQGAYLVPEHKDYRRVRQQAADDIGG